MMYSVPFVGCHPKSLTSLDKSMTKHLRAILRKPAHIGHDTTHQIWAMAQVDRPHEQALNLLKAHLAWKRASASALVQLSQRRRSVDWLPRMASPWRGASRSRFLTIYVDITTSPEVLAYAEGQLHAFQRLAESQVIKASSANPVESVATCIPFVLVVSRCSPASMLCAYIAN